MTCPKGLSKCLRHEIVSLGFPIKEQGTNFVATTGTLSDTIRLNLQLRTAHRVLYLLREFPCRSGDDLYRQSLDIPWHIYIPSNGYVTIGSSVDHPSVQDPRYPNLKCKDAIVDRIRKETGCRPNSGPDRHRAAVYIHWHGGTCCLYLDTSGEALQKRGYRKIPGKAPMQESLAAACVLITNWRGHGHIVNPMCGSGTLAIEATLIGLCRAPGMVRLNFAFMHLVDFPGQTLHAERSAAKAEASKTIDGRIIVTDHDPKAVDSAWRNATTAGVAHLMEFTVCDFWETEIPERSGIVLFNPEYGIRMGDKANLRSVYREIGTFLKRRCSGYTGVVCTGSWSLAQEIGLNPSLRIPLLNGKLECQLLEFAIS